jgi:hypothetical protein
VRSQGRTYHQIISDCSRMKSHSDISKCLLWGADGYPCLNGNIRRKPYSCDQDCDEIVARVEEAPLAPVTIPEFLLLGYDLRKHRIEQGIAFLISVNCFQLAETFIPF